MLRDFLSTYVEYNNPVFKNRFNINGENQYIFKESEKLFVFVQTRSEDLIKKINSQSISIKDLRSELSKGENIGFASYIFIEDSFLAYGSTILAPKINIFCNFIGAVISALGIRNYEFCITPFEKKIQRKDVQDASFIGKSIFQITPENNFFQQVFKHTKDTIQGEANNFDLLDCLEITIKPKKGRDIKKISQDFLSKIEDDGLKKAIFRAREDVQSNLTDLYLVGNGTVSDSIDLKIKDSVASQISSKISNNKDLAEKVGDYEAKSSSNRITAIADYNNLSAWPTSIHSLQMANAISSDIPTTSR